LILFVTFGCQKTPAQSSTQATPATSPQAPPAATPATPAAGAGQPAVPADPAVKAVPAELPAVLARVNGEAIGRAEFEKAVKSAESSAGQQVPAERRDAIYRDLLDRLVIQHLLLQEVAARKISVADTEVDAQVARFRQQAQGEEEFKKALTARGLTLEDLRKEVRTQMAISRMLEAEVGPKIDITEADVKAFYDKNPNEFQQPESYRASHILLRVDPAATDVQKKEARTKIEGLLKQVRGGADFAELAKQHSQDGSAQSGGDLNFFQKGQMVPPFEQAVMALKPGQVSGVVETQFGLHIIKLTEKRAPRTVPLAEVSQRIGQFLLQQAQQQKSGEFIEALKARGKIEILI
jgi:peptidyl-prolyl cis-trans isomerase C